MSFVFTKIRLLAVLPAICCFIFSGCNNPKFVEIPSEPDYSNPLFWYQEAKQSEEHPVDIFYVYPTLLTNPRNENGKSLLFSDVNQTSERLAAQDNQRYNMIVYGQGRFNFYAPYYRQLVFDVFRRDSIQVEIMSMIPKNDIRKAFDYYMTNYNKGKRFILLGHSEGSEMLLDLIKDGMSEEERGRMIAAYLPGIAISKSDLKQWPTIRPASGALDTGVVISYNSVTRKDATSPFLADAAVCINPVNWTTDGTPALRSDHLGYRLYNIQTRSYEITPAISSVFQNGNVLVCSDIDPQLAYMEECKDFFPLGSLHFMDSWMYSENLRKNMLERSFRSPIIADE